jgi:polysaccharide biosynthesis protein PslG
MTRRAALLLLTLVAALLVASPAAHARTPRSFFGVVADGPVFAGNVGLASQTSAMRAAGVGSVRVAVLWSDMQPYATAADVPASRRARFSRIIGGRPTDVSFLDGVVAAAARQGLTVLPVVQRTPTWARAEPGVLASPPRDVGDYARFIGGLVARYGRGGSFWREHPRLRRVPITQWQVWNEPDITKYWSQQPFVISYLQLLRAAGIAIKAQDPRAKVVLAGLTNFSWRELGNIYRAGGGGFFDVVAIHPFSGKVTNVVQIAQFVRTTMRRNGDARKPMLLSEVSFSSGKGRSTHNYGWETTERGQATDVRQLVTQLIRKRVSLRITGFYWYTWLSPRLGSRESFDYAGLRRLGAGGRPVSKPALSAYRAVARRAQR